MSFYFTPIINLLNTSKEMTYFAEEKRLFVSMDVRPGPHTQCHAQAAQHKEIAAT